MHGFVDYDRAKWFEDLKAYTRHVEQLRTQQSVVAVTKPIKTEEKKVAVETRPAVVESYDI